MASALSLHGGTDLIRMPQPCDFEHYLPSTFFSFDSSAFVPNDPGQDITIVMPNVEPFSCHKMMLARYEPYKQLLEQYLDTDLLFLHNKAGIDMVIIPWLYTGTLQPHTFFPLPYFDTLIHLYQSPATCYLFDVLGDIVLGLENYNIDQAGNECEINHFLTQIYFFELPDHPGGPFALDFVLRESMLRPHIKDYVERLMTSWGEGRCVRYNYNMGVAGKLLDDVLSWKGASSVDMNTISLLRFMCREAASIEVEQMSSSTRLQDRNWSDVNELAREVSEMAID